MRQLDNGSIAIGPRNRDVWNITSDRSGRRFVFIVDGQPVLFGVTVIDCQERTVHLDDEVYPAEFAAIVRELQEISRTGMASNGSDVLRARPRRKGRHA